jgi:hypothetical protein
MSRYNLKSDTILSRLGTMSVAAATGAVGTTTTILAYLKQLVTLFIALDYSREICLEKSDGAVLAGKDPLFTITGGPILVTEIVGIVSELLVGAANGTLQADVTTPAATVALCAGAVAIDDDAAGTLYHFVGAGVLTPVTAGVKIIDKSSATVGNCNWVVPVGNINFLGSAARAGVIKWYITYKPLSPLSRVTVAA